MSKTKTVIKKWAIIFVLVLFLGFTALSAIMYLASPSQEDLQAEANCTANGFERDSENKICSDDLSWSVEQEQNQIEEVKNINTQENCIANSGTRYAENKVCITK